MSDLYMDIYSAIAHGTAAPDGSCGKDEIATATENVMRVVAALEAQLAEAERKGMLAAADIADEEHLLDKYRHGCTNQDAAKAIREAAGECTHDGYSFDKHGRGCPKCGTIIMDFGD